MTVDEIREMLFARQDKEYRDFQAKLIPGEETRKKSGTKSGKAVKARSGAQSGDGKKDGAQSADGKKEMIGVRTPELRALAKELSKRGDTDAFRKALPHEFFDEDQLHAFLISEIRDFDACMEEVCAFLPYVDNWATCDQMNPKVFGKKQNRTVLFEQIKKWLKSKKTYEVRFAIRMLMCHFLDEDFAPEYLQMVAKIRSEEYYVNMMIAWYFATALAKQYEATVPILEAKSTLAPWVQNKTIQKAVESYRITDEQKAYLRTLKV